MKEFKYQLEFCNASVLIKKEMGFIYLLENKIILSIVDFNL